jgi:DNA-binding GntR family transcriptional regulator
MSRPPEAVLPVSPAAGLVDHPYDNLHRAILLGELERGARLREPEMAAGFQVSRARVRGAISRLIGDRLVRACGTGSVEVTDITAEMRNNYALREALETCAGRLAAFRVDENVLARLEELLRASEHTDYRDRSRRAEINRDFHLTIASAAASPRSTGLFDDFRGLFLNPHWHRRGTEVTARQSLQDHRAIIDALRVRDGDRAERAIRLHLQRS